MKMFFMNHEIAGSLAAIVLFGTSFAHAAPVVIAQNSNAAIGNFQSPGSTAQVGYTIQTSDNGTNFNVVLTTMDPNAQPFANLYFDTIASTPNTGSNLGFEFGPNSQDAFNPGGSGPFSIAGAGITDTFTMVNGTTTANISIPNSFFLNSQPNLNFTPTPPGTLVSLHLSQSFSYSVVGGSANFAAPVELGDAIVGASAVPEPGSLGLLSIGICALAAARKKVFRA